MKNRPLIIGIAALGVVGVFFFTSRQANAAEAPAVDPFAVNLGPGSGGGGGGGAFTSLLQQSLALTDANADRNANAIQDSLAAPAPKRTEQPTKLAPQRTTTPTTVGESAPRISSTYAGGGSRLGARNFTGARLAAY